MPATATLPSRADRVPAARALPSPAPVAAPEMTYELAGPAGAPLVVALGGISAHRHVVATAENPAPGWWEPVVGPGGGIDTERFRVLGVDFLDGGRRRDGRPARTVTTHDQADALARVLDRLGERRVHAIVGASYGGMVALAFAERYPERVERLVVIGAAHESHPMSTALRAMQRRVVELGLETGRTADALAIARGIAMTTYRTAREFGERFGPDAPDADDAPSGDASASGCTTTDVSEVDSPFAVERYLLHCGARFAGRFPAERFLALSLSTDLHRVDPRALRTPMVLVAAEGDTLVPESQLADLAARAGAPARVLRVPTRYGHDAFLTEPTRIARILRAALRVEGQG